MSTITAEQIADAFRNNPTLITSVSLLYTRSRNEDRDAEIARRVWSGETHGAVGAAYNLSTNRIAQIMSTRPNPNPSPKRHKNAERDRLILAAVAAKIPRAKIARDHDLSVVRVNQIVAANPEAKAPVKAIPREDRIKLALAKYETFETLTFSEEVDVFVSKYEVIARQVVTDMLNGMNQYQLEAKYPSTVTGGDVLFSYAHYFHAYKYFVDPITSQWIR